MSSDSAKIPKNILIVVCGMVVPAIINVCLQRDPRDRPTAKELLKHPFVKRAKRTTYLTELIERHERWSMENGNKGHSDDEDDDDRRDNHPADKR